MIKAMSVAKLKKAVKQEKTPCVLVVDTMDNSIVVDTMDNSIVAKLPRTADVTKYNKYMYMFYYIGKDTA